MDYYVAALDAQRSHVSIVIGLSDFTAHTCPKCGDEGQFKIYFLGRLEHPECHWTSYMGTGSHNGLPIENWNILRFSHVYDHCTKTRFHDNNGI